jgi:tRNA nucleotidyltransferase (CCA-adding enzyme)
MTWTLERPRAVEIDLAATQQSPPNRLSATRDPAQVTAGDLMTSPTRTVDAADSLWHAAQRLFEAGLQTRLVVLDDRRPVGVIDERRLAEAWPHGPFASRHRTVGQITSGSVPTVLPEVSAARVAAIMYDRGVDAVPVVDRRGNVVGLVTAQDILGVLARYDPSPLLGLR